jgi:hypothetical protein
MNGWEFLTSFDSEHDARTFAGDRYFGGYRSVKILKKGKNYLVYCLSYEPYSIVDEALTKRVE